MKFRSAALHDLPQLKAMYRDIVLEMERRQIRIWDDIYPCEFLEEDIHSDRLYVLADGDVIVSAFALCGSNEGAQAVSWIDGAAKAKYIDRLGVRATCSGKGIGGLMLAKAMETAKAQGAEYLRLFVVDSNLPAIRLYEKHGFCRAGGVYHEVIDEDLTLHEFGYEKAL